MQSRRLPARAECVADACGRRSYTSRSDAHDHRPLRQGSHLFRAHPDDAGGVAGKARCPGGRRGGAYRNCPSSSQPARISGFSGFDSPLSVMPCPPSSPSVRCALPPPCRPDLEPAHAATASALTRRRHPGGVLRSIQPASGGFLEATPLTSFVSMSLIAADQAEHPVVATGRRVPRKFGSRRRQLADRHEPCDVGDDAGGERLLARIEPRSQSQSESLTGGRELSRAFATGYCGNDVPSRAPLHSRRTGRLGLDRVSRAGYPTPTIRRGALPGSFLGWERRTSTSSRRAERA